MIHRGQSMAGSSTAGFGAFSGISSFLVGSFIALFDAACGRRPQVIGKPEPTMLEGALRRLGVG